VRYARATLAVAALAAAVAAVVLSFTLECGDAPSEGLVPALVAIAAVALAGAVGIGIGAAAAWGWGLLAFVGVGAVLVPAYNLELAFHNELGFATAWGAFPALTGYFVEAQTMRLEGVAAAAYATAASLAQRALSTPARRAKGSPSTRRTTRQPSRASLMQRLSASSRAEASSGTGWRKAAPLRAASSSSGSIAASCSTVSAVRNAFTASHERRPGSPGPAPTSTTRPITWASATPSRAARGDDGSPACDGPR
jgi:hypothetical protein